MTPNQKPLTKEEAGFPIGSFHWLLQKLSEQGWKGFTSDEITACFNASLPSNDKQGWIDVVQKRIAELKKIDSDFCDIRWDMSKPDYVRKLARDMSNETTARRHELEDLLKTMTLPPQS